MAISSHGTTFTFPGFTAHFTAVSVEEAQAEIVDMTAVGEALGRRRMFPTGDITSPGRVRVDYLRVAGTPAPVSPSLTGALGINGGSPVSLSFSGPAGSFTTKAILESATTEAAVGSFVRGTLNFVIDNST